MGLKRVTVLTGSVRRIERNISPPIRQAITLAAQLEGKRSGITIYVCTTAFADNVPDADLIAAAEEVAWRINRTVP